MYLRVAWTGPVGCILLLGDYGPHTKKKGRVDFYLCHSVKRGMSISIAEWRDRVE